MAQRYISVLHVGQATRDFSSLRLSHHRSPAIRPVTSATSVIITKGNRIKKNTPKLAQTSLAQLKSFWMPTSSSGSASKKTPSTAERTVAMTKVPTAETAAKPVARVVPMASSTTPPAAGPYASVAAPIVP